ncbi:MAG TPA: Uma2 family endonuclease [Thermomicrobiales bacterium]|jgi:Uma2 family endonuclease
MALMPANREVVLRSVDAAWTAADWAQLPHDDSNRYEIIDGVLYVSTAPSARHQRIIRMIVLACFAQIDAREFGITLWSPIGVFMPGAQPVQPDILIVGKDDFGIIDDRRVNGVPTLVVEVLSPSNAEYDHEVKRAAYARAGVPEYWIVRPEERDTLVHSQPEHTTGRYLQISRIPPSGVLVSPTLPFTAPIADFFTDTVDRTR